MTANQRKNLGNGRDVKVACTTVIDQFPARLCQSTRTYTRYRLTISHVSGLTVNRISTCVLQVLGVASDASEVCCAAVTEVPESCHRPEHERAACRGTSRRPTASSRCGCTQTRTQGMRWVQPGWPCHMQEGGGSALEQQVFLVMRLLGWQPPPRSAAWHCLSFSLSPAASGGRTGTTAAKSRLCDCPHLQPLNRMLPGVAPPRTDREALFLLQEASAKFQSLQRIYAVLSDPKKWVSAQSAWLPGCVCRHSTVWAAAVCCTVTELWGQAKHSGCFHRGKELVSGAGWLGLGGGAATA